MEKRKQRNNKGQFSKGYHQGEGPDNPNWKGGKSSVEGRRNAGIEYRKKNRDKIAAYLREWGKNNKARTKEYRKINADKLKKQHGEWRLKNRAKVLASKKRWYFKHRERLLKYHNEHYHKNKESILPKMRSYQKSIRARRTAYENKYRSEREKTDPAFLLSRRLRARARIAFTRKGFKKGASLSNLLGCTYKEAQGFIEKQLLTGMTWKNYGTWHIDHRKPIDAFDLSDITQQKLAFHYSNLQPLWAETNLKKGRTYAKPL